MAAVSKILRKRIARSTFLHHPCSHEQASIVSCCLQSLTSVLPLFERRQTVADTPVAQLHFLTLEDGRKSESKVRSSGRNLPLSNTEPHLISLCCRTILVKLVSTALTGFFYTARRPRLSEKLAFRKYDPVGEYAGCSMLVRRLALPVFYSSPYSQEARFVYGEQDEIAEKRHFNGRSGLYVQGGSATAPGSAGTSVDLIKIYRRRRHRLYEYSSFLNLIACCTVLWTPSADRPQRYDLLQHEFLNGLDEDSN